MEQSHMLHVWYIYLHNWLICKANVGIHISAPWSKKGSVSFPPNFGGFGMKQECVATAASACSPHLASAAL